MNQPWIYMYSPSWSPPPTSLSTWCSGLVHWEDLEKTLESPLDRKEIKPVNPKGNQLWIFIAGTDPEVEVPVLWPPGVKSWLIRKDRAAGNDWEQEEKGMAEDEMTGWHHQLKGLREMVKDKEAWCAAKSLIWLNYWTTIAD